MRLPALQLVALYGLVALSFMAGPVRAQPLIPLGDPDRNVKLRIRLDRASIKAFEPVYLCLSAEQFAENLSVQVTIRNGDGPWQPVVFPNDAQHPDPWTRSESHMTAGLPVLKMGMPLLVGQVGDTTRFLFSVPGEYKIRVKAGPDSTNLSLTVVAAAPDDENAATILGADLFPRLFEADHKTKPDDKVKEAAAHVVARYRDSTPAHYCQGYLLTTEFRAESLKREPPLSNKKVYGPLAKRLDESAEILRDSFFGEEMAFYAAYAHGLSADFEGLIKEAESCKSSLTPWAEALYHLKKDVERHLHPGGASLPVPVEVPESSLPKINK